MSLYSLVLIEWKDEATREQVIERSAAIVRRIARLEPLVAKVAEQAPDPRSS